MCVAFAVAAECVVFEHVGEDEQWAGVFAEAVGDC